MVWLGCIRLWTTRATTSSSNGQRRRFLPTYINVRSYANMSTYVCMYARLCMLCIHGKREKAPQLPLSGCEGARGRFFLRRNKSSHLGYEFTEFTKFTVWGLGQWVRIALVLVSAAFGCSGTGRFVNAPATLGAVRAKEFFFGMDKNKRPECKPDVRCGVYRRCALFLHGFRLQAPLSGLVNQPVFLR